MSKNWEDIIAKTSNGRWYEIAEGTFVPSVTTMLKGGTPKDEWFYKLDKTDKLIDNVRQHYRRDYEHLYPELDSSLQEGEKTKT